MAGQTKRESLEEALANVALGYWVSLAAQLIIYPAFGKGDWTYADNIRIGVCFMAVSLARSYSFRRFFNWLKGWRTRRRVRNG